CVSAIALTHVLNLPYKSVKGLVDKNYVVLSEGNSTEDIRNSLFRNSCEWLKANESASFTKAALQLCNDIVYADGTMSEKERKLMSVANSILR
ncbi:MAG: hypothetical protein ACKPB3_10120, partial [Bacteroidota bacterium]